MRRRHFLTLAGAAAAFPRVALAQQTAKVPRVALASSGVPTSAMVIGGDANWSAMLQQLARNGFVEGQTIVLERYLTPSDGMVAERVRIIIATSPDLIFWGGATAAAQAAVGMNQTMPMLAWVGDFVTQGLVDNLARPGRNISGISSVPGADMDGKMLALLTEAVPAVKRVAYFADGADGSVAPATQAFFASANTAAQKLGVTVVPVLVKSGVTIEDNFVEAFANIAKMKMDAIQFALSPTVRVAVPVVARLTLEARLPCISPYLPFTEAGGLMSYGPDQLFQSRQVADYIALVLRGARPGELPVLQPTAFDFAINLKTAKALGLTIPPDVLFRAERVIE